ncbi:MAG: hypothetical protein R3A44_36120 [Caldilineaceae bacterium]
MKKQILITVLAGLLLGAGYGNTPAQAQGFLRQLITPEISGTLGNNGIYVSNVNISWQNVIPADALPETIIGCVEQTLTQDTPPEGVVIICAGERASGGTFAGGAACGQRVPTDHRPPRYHAAGAGTG